MKLRSLIYFNGALLASGAFLFGETGTGRSALGPSVFAPTSRPMSQLAAPTHKFSWKPNIVTTVFWIGEKPSANNPVPNRSSSWDANWTQNYGGYDDPDPTRRRDLIPVSFTPRQNPFYCALPYNDK